MFRFELDFLRCYLYFCLMAKLNTKQELFCIRVSEGNTASEAYRLAYPHSCKWKAETVHNKASALHRKGEVVARVKELQHEQRVKSNLTKERLLDELEIILDANISDYVSIVTKTIVKNKGKKNESTHTFQAVEFKDFSELTPRQLRAIEGVKQGKSGIELKLLGRGYSIERICKMLGYDASNKVDVKTITEQPLFGDNEKD